jgi:hypothetical protein
MRKSVIASLLMVMITLSFGCKKDSSDETPAVVATGLTVKFDGTLWTAAVSGATYFTGENLTSIIAGNLTGQEVSIWFKGGDTGTYNIMGSGDDNTGSFLLGTAETDAYFTVSDDDNILLGKVVVTEYDKTKHTISGTFYFDAFNSDNVKKTFSEGKFNKIAYQTI